MASHPSPSSSSDVEDEETDSMPPQSKRSRLQLHHLAPHLHHLPALSRYSCSVRPGLQSAASARVWPAPACTPPPRCQAATGTPSQAPARGRGRPGPEERQGARERTPPSPSWQRSRPASGI